MSLYSTVSNYGGWILKTWIPGDGYTLINPEGYRVEIRGDDARLIGHEIHEYEAEGAHPADYYPDLWEICTLVFNLTQHGPKGGKS